ncbi:serine protease, partial [Streptomyces lavendulocolor]
MGLIAAVAGAAALVGGGASAAGPAFPGGPRPASGTGAVTGPIVSRSGRGAVADVARAVSPSIVEIA